VVSPIADLTILTAVATECPMASHLKTTLVNLIHPYTPTVYS